MFGFGTKESYAAMNIDAIHRLEGQPELIDIREPEELRLGSIKGAKNIPMGSLLGAPEQFLRKGPVYYIFCQSGMRSSRACAQLSKLGYTVVNLLGGMSAYSGAKR